MLVNAVVTGLVVSPEDDNKSLLLLLTIGVGVNIKDVDCSTS